MFDGGSTELAVTPEAPSGKRRKMSAAARRRMALGQQKRWAAIKVTTESPSQAATPELGLIGNAPALEFWAWRNAVRRSIFDKSPWRKPLQVWQDDCFMGIQLVSGFRGTLGLGAI
jgi:hypothetical protein